jgi:phosphatidate cytidylyltransferase
MKNVITRVIVFALGIPALIAIIVLGPNVYHLPFNLIVIASSGISAVELAAILASREGSYRIHPVAAAILGIVVPTVTLVSLFLGVTGDAVIAAVITASAILLGIQGFRRQSARFTLIIPAVTNGLFLLIYPGLFAGYLIKLTTLPQSTIVIVVFITAVYLNDSFAYVVGMLVGRRDERLVPVSPNKSLAGFVAGFVTSVGVVIVASLVFPQSFPAGPFAAAILGAAVGAAAITGDLSESAIKRSAVVKDSGGLVPGRGGLLDSVDSPLFSAFVFYYLYQVLFLG